MVCTPALAKHELTINPDPHTTIRSKWYLLITTKRNLS
uniref:Uncharacterized protein n=1 Tax=Rhizophora mucronata TaxID=61149 RepID=A0A2P2PVD4_RHIMU